MTIENRERSHVAPHIRSTEQQILDALLRIEEILERHSVVAAPAEEPKSSGILKRGRK